MPVDIEFSPDQRFIVYTITDPMSMTELVEAYEQEKTFRDSSPYTVHSIIDMSQLKRIPPNWLTARSGPGLSHPRSGYMLFVGLSPGIKLLMQTITKLTNYKKMQVFNTRQEADAFLKTLLEDDSPTADS